MSASCPYEDKECLEKCNRGAKANNCGLNFFLTKMKSELQKFPSETQIIEDLKEKYLQAWNGTPGSRGRGRATGSAFERWIRDQLVLRNLRGKVTSSGPVVFDIGNSKGKFNVDIAIPSLDNPRAILELKFVADLEVAFLMKGLLEYSPEYRKLGLVSFYKLSNPNAKAVLDDLEKMNKRFSFFVIEGNWSVTLDRLSSFVNT